MNESEWQLRVRNSQWYYFRLEFVSYKNVHPDPTTWKLSILKCLQQLRGVFGEAIDFDVLSNGTINDSETIVRVPFPDRQMFAECISAGDLCDLDGSIRVIGKSVSLQGVVTTKM
ncbi:uncharacterized protein C5L36_0A11050 [Pichia kudriavzevii]|uniref:Ribonucleases P/MRP subunit Pop8-like domain-containing protein n=1 Tax=Pichia kudriavzevii TaxID=4909 RepID=A0A2U9QZP0_PICKU|nr:uncharacterized protein C5L36_0A11050 [Pichia kudriavzevii]AWU74522.1 hypothetical protein C5L36_0A11050 [Pichia kudriavzevii]